MIKNESLCKSFCNFFLSNWLWQSPCIEPNKLPDGYIDQEYYIPITISGGTGPVVDLSYEIHPSNSWIEITYFLKKNIYTKYVYNNFTIEGKPQLQLDCNN